MPSFAGESGQEMMEVHFHVTCLCNQMLVTVSKPMLKKSLRHSSPKSPHRLDPRCIGGDDLECVVCVSGFCLCPICGWLMLVCWREVWGYWLIVGVEAGCRWWVGDWSAGVSDTRRERACGSGELWWLRQQKTTLSYDLQRWNNVCLSKICHVKKNQMTLRVPQTHAHRWWQNLPRHPGSL